MDIFTVLCRMFLLVVYLQCVSFILAQDGPQTSNEFYAEVNSYVEMPCEAATHGNKLRWTADHLDGSLRSRARSYVSTENPKLSVYTITNVRSSDAGTFTCNEGKRRSSIELVVIEPSRVLDVAAVATSPDEVKVTWKPPAKNPEEVRGYNVYAKEVAPTGKEVKFWTDDLSPSGMEEFSLTDVSSGSTYEIQVSAVYPKGADDKGETIEGPRSPKVRINTPTIEASQPKVKAQPWKNSTILVTWQALPRGNPLARDGYIVFYEGIGKKDSPSGEVPVRQPESGSKWSAILKGLKTRMRYKIQIAPFTAGSPGVVGPKSPETIYMHDGFVPELSLRAIPLTPDTALVTLDTLGGEKVDKLRIFYSDDSAIKWDRIDTFNAKERTAVVRELQPRTRYFFMAKATVNGKARSVVTHILTPPSILSTPSDVTVTAKSPTSVLVAWHYRSSYPLKGFIIRVEKLSSDNTYRPDKYHLVFNDNQVLVTDLMSGDNYQVKVEAFDAESFGPSSEPALFQLATLDATTVTVPENVPPYFIDDQPEEMEVEAGQDVKLTCAALGSPVPTVQLFKDNVPVGGQSTHRGEITLERVQQSTVVTCRAFSPSGVARRQTLVSIKQRSTPESPRFVIRPPTTRIVNRGDDFRELCQATGYPLPDVKWYKDGVLADSQPSQQGSNIFTESRVMRNMDLKCEAMNQYGIIETYTRVEVRGGEITPQPPQSDYSVSVRVMPMSATEVKIKWVVDRGDLNEIRAFDVSLENKLGDILLRDRMTSDKRSMTLRNLVPDGRYIFNILTRTLAGIVETSNVDFVQTPPHVEPGEPVLYLDIVEVRDTTARVDFYIENADPRRLQGFRFRVLDLTVGALGNQVLDRDRMPPDQPTIELSRLRPLRTYQVILSALGPGNVPFVSVSGNFTTSKPGMSGTPVHTSSQARPNPEPTQQTVTTMKTRPTRTTRQPRTTPTRRPTRPPKVTTTDTPIVETTDAPIVETTELTTIELTEPTSELTTFELTEPTTTETTTEEPDTHILTVKNPKKTPFSVDIRWSVDRGPLEDITEFFVTITGSRGQKLHEASVPNNQRYITIQPLKSNTTYFFNVKAKGPSGVVAEGDVEVLTPDSNKPAEPVNPDLVLEANEIRSSTASIDWTLIDVEPSVVKNYKIMVFDGGPTGDKLLDQTMSSSSQSLNLQSLQSKRRYYVVLQALDLDDKPILTSSLTFETPVPKKSGKPVSSRSSPDGFIRDKRGPSNFQPDMPRSRMTEGSRPTEGPLDEDAHRPDTSTPWLKMEINQEGSNSARVTWTPENLPEEMVKEYVLNVRNQGPQGSVLLSQNIPLDSSHSIIHGLNRNRQYYMEVAAISQSGATVVKAAIPYTHGISETPLIATSSPRDNGYGLAGQRSPEQDDMEDLPSDDSGKPEIDLELNPMVYNQVKVNWSVSGGSSTRPISSYKLSVHEGGQEGIVLLKLTLPLKTTSRVISALEENIRYYIKLDALDASGRVIDYASSEYLVPPSGLKVEPIKSSSRNKDPNSEPSRNKDRDTENRELEIVNAQAEGPHAILVEWYDFTSPNGEPTRNTVVRYAEITDNIRSQYMLQHVSAGHRRITIRGLEADTQYGFQVASMATTKGHYLRWSKMVLRKTTKT